MTTKYFEMPDDAVRGSARIIKAQNHEDRAIVMYEEEFHNNTAYMPKFDHGLNAYALIAEGQYAEASDEEYRNAIVSYTYDVATAQRIADEINA